MTDDFVDMFWSLRATITNSRKIFVMVLRPSRVSLCSTLSWFFTTKSTVNDWTCFNMVFLSDAFDDLTVMLSFIAKRNDVSICCTPDTLTPSSTFPVRCSWCLLVVANLTQFVFVSYNYLYWIQKKYTFQRKNMFSLCFGNEKLLCFDWLIHYKNAHLSKLS